MTSSRERAHDIDWLRVLAVLLLIPYHSAVIFARPYVSYIKQEPNAAFEAFAYFMNQWHMALLFLLSGVGAWYSLESRVGRQYLAERIKRLVVPLVFGTFAIVPVQVYFQRLYYHEFSGSIVEFYPRIFAGIYPHGNFTWGQLWFLAYLFVFSVLLLPVFLHFKTNRGRMWTSRAAAFCNGRLVFLAPAIPFMLAQALLRAKWPGFQNLYNDWANFAFYMTAFLYGYLLFSVSDFRQVVAKRHAVSLALGIVSMGIILGLRQTGNAPSPGYSASWILFMLLHGFSSWCWLVGLLGLGRKYLNFDTPLIQYASEAVLPFYILHHAAIVAAAFFVLKFEAGVMVEFISINILSFILTICFYEFLIRRLDVFRILFGMRAKRPVVVQNAIS